MLAWRRTVYARRVLVAKKSGGAISGVLVARRGDLLVLKNARLHEEQADPIPLDGDAIIERSNVDFIQRLTSTEP